MAFVEAEQHGQVLVVRLNRPDRLNALGAEMRNSLARAFSDFRADPDLEVAILTGTGRGFCAGEDMKESLERGEPGFADKSLEDPLMGRNLDKPVIAAINGFAMGGGFMLVEATDLRVAVKGALFEISEAKRWLLGGYNHGHIAGLPHAIATEMALGFRFTAERLHEVGFLNRVTEADELMPTAMQMAEHLLSLPPAARVNTLYMMRHMQPQVTPQLESLANALHAHGCLDDRMESRQAFAEKHKPVYEGWDDPEDRHRMPTLARQATKLFRFVSFEDGASMHWEARLE